MRAVKISLLGVALMAFSFSGFAQDTIRFTWQAGTTKGFIIQATNGKSFTVNWGNGADSTYIGNGNNDIKPRHKYAAAKVYTVTIVASSADCRFTYLDCTQCQLSSLDVRKSLSLTTLHCHENQLSSLDVSHNTALIVLGCGWNQLSSLNVSNNTSLTHLVCTSNLLSSLDISKHTVLKWLDCGGNQLTDLDVSNNMALTDLSCWGNQLSRLDLTKQTVLTSLSGGNNQLSDLDLSKNTLLTGASLSYNQLGSLDVSKNTKLEALYCEGNQLERLDLSKNTALTNLDCFNNHLPLSDLYVASKRISYQYVKRLGPQILMPQAVEVGDSIDFSTQAKFESIATNFKVEKNGQIASQSDYSINNGVIIFTSIGNYKITMINSAIISNEENPAQVIVEFSVGGVGIAETDNYPPLRVYPNPAKNGELTISLPSPPAPKGGDASEGGAYTANNIEIYSVVGQRLTLKTLTSLETLGSLGKVTIDISHLASGMYFLKINNQVVKFIKE